MPSAVEQLEAVPGATSSAVARTSRAPVDDQHGPRRVVGDEDPAPRLLGRAQFGARRGDVEATSPHPPEPRSLTRSTPVVARHDVERGRRAPTRRPARWCRPGRSRGRPGGGTRRRRPASGPPARPLHHRRRPSTTTSSASPAVLRHRPAPAALGAVEPGEVPAAGAEHPQPARVVDHADDPTGSASDCTSPCSDDSAPPSATPPAPGCGRPRIAPRRWGGRPARPGRPRPPRPPAPLANVAGSTRRTTAQAPIERVADPAAPALNRDLSPGSATATRAATSAVPPSIRVSWPTADDATHAPPPRRSSWAGGGTSPPPATRPRRPPGRTSSGAGPEPPAGRPEARPRSRPPRTGSRPSWRWRLTASPAVATAVGGAVCARPTGPRRTWRSAPNSGRGSTEPAARRPGPVPRRRDERATPASRQARSAAARSARRGRTPPPPPGARAGPRRPARWGKRARVSRRRPPTPSATTAPACPAPPGGPRSRAMRPPPGSRRSRPGGGGRGAALGGRRAGRAARRRAKAAMPPAAGAATAPPPSPSPSTVGLDDLRGAPAGWDGRRRWGALLGAAGGPRASSGSGADSAAVAGGLDRDPAEARPGGPRARRGRRPR